MSETTTDQAPTAETDQQQTAQGDPADKPLGEKGEKALRAERDRANELDKALKAAQAKLDQIEQAKLSDLEKAQKEAQEAAKKLAEYERTTLRQKVALDEGVPAKWVDRLKGETEADLRADALAILADLQPASTTPKPDLSQGGKGEPPALNSSTLENALRAKLGAT